MEIKTSQIIESAKHARSFITYRIKLVTKRPAEELTFDELWIEDRLYKIKITNEKNQPVESRFQKKQVLYIDVESEVSQPALTPPVTKSGSRVFLGYQVNNIRKYFPITEFDEESPRLAAG